MRTADLDYPLEPSAIAQHPAEPRDAARLLVDHGPGQPVEHRHVRDLPEFLRAGDLLVVNDTRVLPARLHLVRASGGAVEVLLLDRLDEAGGAWEALVRPSRKLKVGERVHAPHDPAFAVEIGARRGDGATRVVTLLGDGDPLAALVAHGEMPLPPYITAPLADPDRYQTVYAERPASSAAPTAGLHLTPAVLDALAAKGVGLARVELVVGLDTFKPIAVDDPAEHVIHTEAYRVDPAVLDRCRSTRAAGGRVVDVLLTNFHLPRTTLLLLVDAFVGPRWRELYATALDTGYRFLSFGDAMLLERAA